MMKQKIVLKLDLHTQKHKIKAIQLVATLHGIDQIAVDMEEQKMTVIGTVDPVHVVEKLRGKLFPTAKIFSVGQGGEEGRKKERRGQEERQQHGPGVGAVVPATAAPPAPERIYDDLIYDGPLESDGIDQLAVDMKEKMTVKSLGKVEEGTVQDGTSITTSNPLASSTSHDGTSVAISNYFAPTDSLESILHGQSSTPLAIPFRRLKKITDNFSHKRILGRGGSCVVYKGELQNGEIIAVKKIIESSHTPGLQKQFENEVYNLMTLKHRNIVRCLGYCYETQNGCEEYNGEPVFAEIAAVRLLCLEYSPNKSLDKYITDESSGLDWSTRYKIIEGICYGLCHLHVENGKPIMHLDLKPANILLDDGMVPKITDFGLSRLLDQQKTIHTKSLVGTFGYMAPEFLQGTITTKSDIFSLGVIIIEVVTGHWHDPYDTRTSSDGFINPVLNKWRNVLEKSSSFGALERDCQQIERCIQVGLICVNLDRTKRPPIAKIINILQGLESINCDTSTEAA